MADIVLNRRDVSTRELHFMPRGIAESILQRMMDVKIQRINLHALWDEAPDYSEWFLRELRNRNIHVTVCVNTLGDLFVVDQYMEEEIFKEICLFKDDSAEPGEDFDTIKGVSFFLPVEEISRDGSLYQKVISRLQPFKRIKLGINWLNRLSGPSPIAEADYQAWAETTVSLINILSEKKITSTLGCGLKQCMFSKEQLGLLPTKLVKWPIASCDHTFFYDVDGTLSPCMRLELPDNLKFNHETDLKDAGVAFLEWLGPFSGHCMESEDLNCRTLRTSGCFTGCLQHSIDEWQSF